VDSTGASYHRGVASRPARGLATAVATRRVALGNPRSCRAGRLARIRHMGGPMRTRLPALLAAALCLPLAACASDAGEGPSPYDDDYPVSELDPLFQDAPNNNDLEEEGKADAVYPRQFFELMTTQSPVKSQGSRGVCSIFASVAHMEHLYLKEGTLPNPDFSEQYLQWSAKVEARTFPNTEGSNGDSNLRAIADYGIVMEADWPYESRPWTSANDPACTGEDNLPTRCYTNGDPPERARTARKWRLPRGRYVNTRRNSIKAHLTSNKTGVVAGMTFFYQSWNHRLSELPINTGYWRRGVVLAPNARDRELSLAKRAGHAILIVGWDDDLEVQLVDDTGALVTDAGGNPVTEKGFWIFKNSWGTGSFGVDNPHGDGYGYLSMKYVEDWASGVVTNVPVVQVPREVCDNGIDDDLDGAIDCDDSDCADHPVCQPESVTRTYAATPELAIPDNDPVGVASTIAVADTGVVGGLKVTVDISHTYRGDLRVVLHHAGRQVVLHDRTGGTLDDLKTTFTVTDLDGEPLQGDWRLQVSDHARIDTGTLHAWSIEVVSE
jgi:hypothetical protein